MPEPVRTYLVRAPNWVGDAVMALPFFASLRANAPGDRIVCLCRESTAPLFAHDPAIDEVIVLEGDSRRRPVRFIRHNARRLAQADVDCAFCLPNSFSSALMLRLGGARRRIGYAADRRSWLLTDRLPFGANGARPHRVEGYLKLLEPVFERPHLAATRSVTVPDKAVRDVAGAWPAAEGRALSLAPGAAQPNKTWEAERFTELGRRWLDAGSNRVVVLVGSPGEMTLCAEIGGAVGDATRTVNLAGRGDLMFAAAAIDRCAVFCGNDSGLSHLAAAVGTPVVSISGPGDPAEVAPYTERQTTVATDVFCKPCYKNVCWRKDVPLECLKTIDVDRVWDAVMRMTDNDG